MNAEEITASAQGPDVIVVHLGLDPMEPCGIWDREKSAVTNREGERIGYVDANDGMRVYIYLDETRR